MFRSMLKSSNSSRGMSLVELLLVMAILSVVMMAVMSLYVPTHQATVAQTQVSDVQQNLRLAANTMTRDLMTAGFLASRYPIVFSDAKDLSNNVDPSADDLSTIGTASSTEFIIRTRSVGRGFARVASASLSGSVVTVTVADASMLNAFSDGDTIRVFGPMNGEELTPGLTLTVNSGGISGAVLTSTASTTTDLDTNEWKEAVLVKVKDNSQPAMQTIRYRLNSEGGLERIVNGVTQILARNLDSVVFSYEPYDPPLGRVRLVNIKLTGETKALKDDAISNAKTREVTTSVRLRNVF